MKNRTLFLLVLILVLLLSACALTGEAAEPTEPLLEAAGAARGQTIPASATPTELPPDVPPSTRAPAQADTTSKDSAPVKTSPTPPAGLPTAGVSLPAETNPPPASEFWQKLPVIPMVGDRPKDIFQRGLELGNNAHAYSKIGDCGSTPAWFLGDFDRGTRFYSLGPYIELESVIAYFSGSHERTSLAARSGFNVSSIFSPLWVNRDYCGPDEAPLACEYRVHKPAMAFIMLGTNDVFHPDDFEPGMRRIIEYSIDNGVIPILTTKADNQEGDHRINATLARLALEYDVPLWNYWRAVQELPNQGLQEDGAHLSWGPNRFDDPEALEKAWTVRNLTALQALDAVWRAIQ
ncbi:MAG TPA: hypothetical protein VLS48_05615 [Anaerolineales bacterium]|nr:hypothetical protein [Anaerolineales bacterium]